MLKGYVEGGCVLSGCVVLPTAVDLSIFSTSYMMVQYSRRASSVVY